MARGRTSPARWSTRFVFDPNARKAVMGNDGNRAQLQEQGRKVKAALSKNVRNSAYRSRLIYRTHKVRGEWVLWVGTWSSFAHWEEFGMRYWRGPIAPLRRTMHSMGYTHFDTDGPNSEDPG